MPASTTLPFGGEPEQGGPLLAVLILRRGVSGMGHVAVRQPTVRIGRAEGNDVVLPAVSLSATHAELRLRGGVWSLTDLGSMNGSWVDGEPVYGAVPLGPGSSIRLGEVEAIFSPKDRWEDSPSTLFVEAAPLEPAPGPPLPEAAPMIVAAPRRSRFLDDDVPTFVLPDTTRRPGPLLFIAIALAIAAVAYFLRQVS
jgi:hypothetical protein